ncbi:MULTISPECIES: pyocin knob domain-containing protein [unclassified Pseudomonas]|uniref:pyocin knob domain-containing protein n=1 Tax=unclassified Pseudomonas TaxID=196821 RepID=UPI000A1F0BDA|nr:MULTISPECIES: pyocin knob domain-containing protein [unclassified Pseudomonas]
MTLKTIKAGAQPNDGTGDNLRTGAQIINENFAELDQRAAQASAQLSSIETGATRNRPDAELLARANHTGAQPASTISDFSPAVKAILQQYGLAEKIRDIPESQLNGLSVNTFTFCRPAGAGILPSQVNHYVIHLQLNDAGFAMQIAVNFLSGKSYSRIKDNGNWQAQWVAGIAKGDYGVGAKDDAPFVGVNQNPDTYLTGGYAVGQFTILGTSLTGVLITQAGSNSTAAAQQFVDWATGKMFTRGKSSNTWSAWRSVVSGGEFGIGGLVPSPSGKTMNERNVTGIYGWAADYAGAPSTSTNGEYITLAFNTEYGRATQLAFSHDTDEMWFRRDTSGWQPWKTVVLEQTGLTRNRNGTITDLNNIQARTVVWVDTSVKNTPFTSDWYVECFGLDTGGVGAYTMQRATTLNNSELVYVRKRVGGAWGQWFRQTPEFLNNGNGSAVKFADGTLICYSAASTKNVTNIALGAIFASDQRSFSFPVPFVVEPIVTWSSSSSSNGVCWGNCEWSNTTQTVGRLNSAFSTIDGYLRYIAIGRWR